MPSKTTQPEALMSRFTARLALTLAALALLGCEQSNTSPATQPTVPAPEFSLGSGVTLNALIARGSIGVLHLESQFEKYHVNIETPDNTDVELRNAVIAPGGFSGWHKHPGPVIVALQAGDVTVYDASNPGCRPVVHHAGEAFIEGTTVHNLRNEGHVDVVLGDLFFVPQGAGRRIEADPPPNCPA
jgi:quercetin dioxygenase-like cupin family protein